MFCPDDEVKIKKSVKSKHDNISVESSTYVQLLPSLIYFIVSATLNKLKKNRTAGLDVDPTLKYNKYSKYCLLGFEALPLFV